MNSEKTSPTFYLSTTLLSLLLSAPGYPDEVYHYDCWNYLTYGISGTSQPFSYSVTSQSRWINVRFADPSFQVVSSKNGEAKVRADVNTDRDPSAYQTVKLNEWLGIKLGEQLEWLEKDYLTEPNFPEFEAVEIREPLPLSRETGEGRSAIYIELYSGQVNAAHYQADLFANYYDSSGKSEEGLSHFLNVIYHPNGMPKNWKSLKIWSKNSLSAGNLGSKQEIICEYLESTRLSEKTMKRRIHSVAPLKADFQILLGKTPRQSSGGAAAISPLAQITVDR